MRPLDGPDLFHLAQERVDRPMHTLKVAVLDRRVACDEVDRWAEQALTQVEPLRRRLARLPLSRPVWTDGGDPHVGYHVCHVELAEPGGEAQLSDLLSDLCSGPLDRSRPLWRLWHVQGLTGGRDALVLQVHHAVGDGAASVALWEALADGADREPHVPLRVPTRALAPSVVARGVRDIVRFPSQVRRFTAYLRHARQVERSGEPVVAKAFLGPRTRFNVAPEPDRQCAFVALELSKLQSVRRATGASLNEVFLTVCGGAVRRHLAALGEPPDAGLTATVPAALPERPHTYGNAVTTLYVALHSDIDDPAARLDAVRRSFAASRRSADRDVRLLPDWQRYPRLNRGIVSVMELAERRGGRPAYNLIVSSVRGPRPFALTGARVVELRSIGPLAGRIGLNITGWSYGDDFMVGIHTYRSAGEHLDRLGPLLLAELDELEARVTVVATDDVSSAT
ncbi:MAG: WS/DGAT domain-containing protein [Acidimicrobiales bacterium]|nr:WS/DGAT domain-containing protein [Acidimicrobiales bacterium]